MARLEMVKCDLVSRLKKESLTAGRFGVVGLFATTVHVLVAIRLVSATALPVLFANLVAFLVAFSISFAGNYYWTFRAPGKPANAMRRYFLISVSAFSANTVLLAGLLRAGWLSPAGSTAAAAVVIPCITFLASRLWGFRRAETESVRV